MFEVKKGLNSTVEIKGEIEASVFEQARPEAIKHLSEKVNIDGFRKGHVPENVLEKHVGEIAILEEMAHITISKNYGKILLENKIDAIGYPNIQITKLAKGNPLGFTITVAVVPEMTLPDYKKIAKEINSEEKDLEVTEEDMKTAFKHLQNMRAREEKVSEEDIKAGKLPEIDDDYAKKLGDFKNVDELKGKIKENIKQDKEAQAIEKNRLKIIEKVIEETKIEIPDVLIKSETEKIKHKVRTDIENMGLKFDDYLKHLNKTIEDLEKDWKVDAEKRAKMQLIVAEIAKEEKLKVDAEKVAEEVKKITENYKDADLQNAQYYVQSVLLNEEVFKFLENQK